MHANYRKPTGQRIERSAKSKRLYQLEEERNQKLSAAAKVQGEILGFTPEQFYTHSLPEQLLSTLNSYDKTASELAAVALLEARDYKVTAPAKA